MFTMDELYGTQFLSRESCLKNKMNKHNKNKAKAIKFELGTVGSTCSKFYKQKKFGQMTDFKSSHHQKKKKRRRRRRKKKSEVMRVLTHHTVVIISPCVQVSNHQPVHLKFIQRYMSIMSRPVSYTHLTLPTTRLRCRSRWSPYH